jgi:hypothetical protein
MLLFQGEHLPEYTGLSDATRVSQCSLAMSHKR